MKKALSIAGSDSGGGAGIEADLKTFSSLGVWGTVVITSVTAQNTQGVISRYDVPPEEVRRQIEAIFEDMMPDGIKSGMLANSSIIREVRKCLAEIEVPYVLDPVMVAKSGDPLLDEEAMPELKRLISIATLVTPNIPEAEKLTGIQIRDLEGAKKASEEIVETFGAEGCVVKGGHLPGDPVDVLYWRGRHYVFSGPRISGGSHGTGCVFSAAITAFLAKGKKVPEAVREGKKFVSQAILNGHKVGKGNLPVDPSFQNYLDAEKWRVYSELKEAVREIEKRGESLRKYFPEVGSNFVYSLPRDLLRGIEDVAGVMGRIVKYGKGVKAVGPVEFGASDHMARAIMKISEKFPEVRSAINLAYSPELLSLVLSKGMRVSKYDRREEPKEIREVEGRSVSWGISKAIEGLKDPPDVIYHEGAKGKEAMLLIFGRSPKEVLEKLRRIGIIR